MRVLILSPSVAGVGGIQRYTTTFVRALEELLPNESVRRLMLPDVSQGNGQGRLSMRSKINFGCRALREAVRWRPDLIICTHLALGPVGWLVSKVRHRPYWIIVYGIEAWALLPLIRRVALRHAGRVISISKFTQEQVTKRHRIERERQSLLPCSLDDGFITAEPARSGPHQSLAEGQRVILTVARMAASEQYKGHEVILQALPSVLSQVPNLTYVVAGEGDDRARIEALADTLGLRQKVLFTGRVSDSELAALYQRCDVFALVPHTEATERQAKGEGFGMVFLEAMAFGKPVVGPNNGAPAEIIHHGQHGLLVNPDDSGAVAWALIDLLTNPRKARNMGEAGRDWVCKQYSYSSFHEKLKGILNDAAQMRSSTTQFQARREKSAAVGSCES